MFKKLVPALVAGTMLLGTPVVAFADYEYGYDNSNELRVIAQDNVAYMYFTYDPNGNLIDAEYCQNPTNLVATYDSSSGGYLLTWNAVPGAVSYKVYRNGSALLQTITTSQSLVNLPNNGGLSNDFYVSAVFGDGVTEGGASNTVTLLPAPFFTGTNTATSTTATLTWGAVTGATGYRVFADGNLVQTTTSTTVTLQQLAPNHTYNFQVEAYNSQNEGLYGSEQVTTLAVPTVTASNLSTSGVTLSWNACPNANYYNIYLNGTKIATNDSTTYVYTGTISSSATTTFRVSAVYPTGEGAESDPTIILPATTITSGTSTVSTATVYWNSVSGATGYTVTMTSTGTNPTSVTQTVTGTSATFSNLPANTGYTFFVAPMSGNTQGFTSTGYMLSTTPVPANDAVPYNVKATFGQIRSGTQMVYNGTTTISWSAPSSANSSTTYIVYKTDSTGKVLSTLASGITMCQTNLSIAGNTTMSIAVAAVTNGVQTANSSVYTFTTPSTSTNPPPPPM